MKKYMIIALLMLFTVELLLAEPIILKTDSIFIPNNAAFTGEYYSRCFEDAGRIALSPFTSSWKGYLATAAIIGTGFILFNNDLQISEKA
ncbi:MAG: hypothetical protein GQ534_12480, partial [Candidatus Delongbacteria bacterium]|nr:hypothetical protein [Candidatus Delongbacteria bacterium]